MWLNKWQLEYLETLTEYGEEEEMNMIEWLSSETSARLILTLGHSLWQGLLIAILATILNASFVRSRRRSSTLTYSIWLVALAALIACPFITFALTSTGEFVSERSVAVLPSQDRAFNVCLLYTSPSPRDRQKSRMPSSA